MYCPKCHTENPEGSKFCLECGKSLDHKCSHCNNELSLSAKFCNSCGQRIDKLAELTKPIPVADNERKYVTVLFCDLSGYTSMSEKLDPEEVKEIMGRIFGEISQVVTKYEGFIEKFVGDAVMALFGATKANEDDPVRAIKAAREIHEIIKGISPTLKKKIGRSIAMHTGINTGLVVTGEVYLEKGTHGVLGDTINVAARFLGLAKADEIIVGPLTYQQTEGYFHFEKLEPTKVKGKEEPIQTYRVVSAREEPTKIHRISGLRADLIGRKVEMSQLQEAMNNLMQGKGFIYSVVGDAGTGKSRLIEEFRATLSSQDIQWREGHCYAYTQIIPYFPLIDLFNRAWQIKEGDLPEIVRKKVESGIKYLLEDDEEVIPYIGTLYSLSYPEIEGVSPELWKTRLHKGVQSILSALSRKGPAVICLEDLHWADTSSLELLRFILNDFQLPAVFLFAYRPTFSLFTFHQLTVLNRFYSEIKLQDLSSSEAQTMVESLLKTEAIPSDIKKFIQTNVEGNPFYLEEAINSLIESETLIRDNGSWKLTKQISEAIIPSTVQGIISARLDRLELNTKRVLQKASVIGRTFLYEILTRIADPEDHVDKSLKELEWLDFIRTKSIKPELEYIFKHALTQEVVYNGLLKKERRVLHERIGIVMEQLFHNRLPEFYETIANHYKQGHSHFKAVDYLIKSGEKSFKRYALEESHYYFKEAYDLISVRPEKTREAEELLIALIIKWSYAYFYRADYIGLLNLTKAHESLVESNASKEQLVMFYNWFGCALSRRDMPVEGYPYVRKALQIAEEIGDIKGIGYSCMWLTQVCADMGLLDEAISYGKRAREVANRFESDQELFRMAFHLSAYAHFFRGDVKKTADYGQALLNYGRKHSDLRSIARHCIASGYSPLSAGDYLSAIEYFKKSIQISPDPSISHVARLLLGMSYLATGQLKEAQSTAEEVIEYSEKFGYEWTGAASQGLKGMVLIAQGNLKQGVSLYENVVQVFLENKSLYRYAAANQLMGMVYSKFTQTIGGKKDFSFIAKNFSFLIKTIPFAHKKAEEHLNIAIKTAGEIKAKSVLGQSYLELGKLYKVKGKTEKARKCITNAIEVFEQCEAETFLKQAQDELASLN